MGSHVPVRQNVPAAQVTLAQGEAKQPGTHTPPTQVVLSGHTFPAQSFTVRTQPARHSLPTSQAFGVQGSSTHFPAKHTWGLGQSDEVRHAWVPASEPPSEPALPPTPPAPPLPESLAPPEQSPPAVQHACDMQVRPCVQSASVSQTATKVPGH